MTGLTSLQARTTGTFSSLSTRNYRLWFAGQAVSVAGTWMQTVAQAWLVLELTGSGALLGLVTALQFLPTLLGGPMAGVLIDRIDKRRLLFWTQGIAGLLGLILGLATLTGVIELWMVLVLALLFGCVTAIDNPARQTFVVELVGPAGLANAVTLNSVLINAARVIGPGIAGLLIASAGVAACFLLNAASYLAALAALVAMRRAELQPADRPARTAHQLTEGLRYVWGNPALRIPLLMMAAMGTLTYEFQVVLPLLARFTFDAGAQGYGWMTAAMGGGAVVGGLATATRTPSNRRLVGSAAVLGALVLAVAAAPTLALTLIVLPVMGAVSIVFISTANATLQLRTEPAMRGRVMSLYMVAFLGSTPIGGPIIGWVGEHMGPRISLSLSGATALIAACVGAAAFHRVRAPRQPSLAEGPVADPCVLASRTEARAMNPGAATPPPTIRDRPHRQPSHTST